MKQTSKPKTWSPEQIARWETIRVKGKARYLFIETIKFFLVLAGMSLVSSIIESGLTDALAHLSKALPCLWIPLAGGFCIASFNWWTSEWSYAAVDPEGFKAQKEAQLKGQQREQIVRWEKVKTKGLMRYLATRGLAFAFAFCVVMLLNNWYEVNHFYQENYQGNSWGFNGIGPFLVDFAKCYAAGIAYAYFCWHLGEDMCRRNMAELNKPSVKRLC